MDALSTAFFHRTNISLTTSVSCQLHEYTHVKSAVRFPRNPMPKYFLLYNIFSDLLCRSSRLCGMIKEYKNTPDILKFHKFANVIITLQLNVLMRGSEIQYFEAVFRENSCLTLKDVINLHHTLIESPTIQKCSGHFCYSIDF